MAAATLSPPFRRRLFRNLPESYERVPGTQLELRTHMSAKPYMVEGSKGPRPQGCLVLLL